FAFPGSGGTNGYVLSTDGSANTSWIAAAVGTVTSVNVSGGSTGLTFSGGAITSSGTITMAGTLAVASGGTGAATLTGYVKGSGTSAFTASSTIPGADISGNISGNAANITGVYAGTITSGQVTSALGYTPPQPGGSGATGTWGINITGSAGSATTATTATNQSGGTVSATTGTFSTSLTVNGKIGINTASPAGDFEAVNTNAVVYSSGSAGYGAFCARGSGNNAGYIFLGNITNGEQARISGFDTGILVFSTGNTNERMRIVNSTGRVGIGTTSPNYLLDVNGTGGFTGALTLSADALFGSAVSPTSQYSVGFRGIPQSGGTVKTANYGAVLTDAGQHILSNSGLTITIPANGSVAYPIGASLTFVNANNSGNVSIAITTDTMTLANTAGTTGTRTLGPNGVATAIKIGATSWIISGNGLT
ncbi:MAG: hypothetical protein WCG06_01915, partial [Candidatus Omnitrophota bacterium]